MSRERRWNDAWGLEVGHRRGSWEHGRKRKGTSSVLYGTRVELVQLARTQGEETNPTMDKTERFNRSTGAEKGGH